jgi:hypothetical protein
MSEEAREIERLKKKKTVAMMMMFFYSNTKHTKTNTIELRPNFSG